MKKKVLLKYIFLGIGIIMTAYPVVAILRPNGLMTGGITGIARILETVLANATTLEQNLLFNLIYYILALVVLAIAFLFLGKEDGLKVIFISFVYPLFLFLFTFLKVPAFTVEIPFYMGGVMVGSFNDLLIPALAYGVIGGIGTGLVVKSGFTSGGSDTIAKLIYKKFLPFLSIGMILLVVDGIIILSSIFFFDIKITAYAFITKFIYIKSMDMIVFGIGKRRVKIEIVSDYFDELSDYIINTVHRGITFLEIEGGYSHATKKQIICICTPRESLVIKQYIANIDRNAFVYIIPLISIWGRGFNNILKDDLSDE